MGLPVEPARVGGKIVPSLDRPAPDAQSGDLRQHVDDLSNSISGLQQALQESKLREMCREDWHGTVKVDTNVNVAALPIKVSATKLTGGRPFNSLTVVSVGGGSLVVSINGEEAMSVAAGDSFRDEIIWSVEAWVTSAASGTARLRAGAYVGR